MKSRVLIMLLTLLFVLSPFKVLAETVEKEKINYVSLGDSLAAGLLFNREFGVGYVGSIVEGLETSGYQVNVYNKGIPGATSADLLASLLDASELAEADIVTISAGANDLLAALDLAKAEKFDPVYLSPEAVLQIRLAAETVASQGVEAAVKQADEAIDEALINIEAIGIGLIEVLTKIAPYESILPEDLEMVIYDIVSYLFSAQAEVAKLQENPTTELNFSDLEALTQLIEEKLVKLEQVSTDLASMIDHIALFEASLATYSAIIPDPDEIKAGLETVRTLTSIAATDVATTALSLNSGLATINSYLGELEEISLLVENAAEVFQMMATLPNKIEEVGQNIGQVIMAIRQVNPNAKVYVLGYYNALPYLSEELQWQVTIPLLVGLNEATQAAATATGAVFIPTYTLFEGMYETYLPNPADIHPSELGYQIIAEAFLSEISKSFPEQEVIPPVIDEEDTETEVPIVDDEEETEAEVPTVIDEEDTGEVTPPAEDEENNEEANEKDGVEKVLTGNKEGAVKASENRLPNTATNQYQWLLAGILLLFLGSSLLLIKQKRQQI